MVVVITGDAAHLHQPAIERASHWARRLRSQLQIIDERARIPAAALVVVDRDSPARGWLVRSLETSVLVVNSTVMDAYRRPLIATDHDDATAASWVLNLLEPTAQAIRLVNTYRIPLRGGRALLRTVRLEHELNARAREDLDAFVSSSGIERTRFELRAPRGDTRDVMLEEIASSDCDLAVIAFRHTSMLSRFFESRLVTSILARDGYDVLVVRRSRIASRGHRSKGALLPLGPW